MIKVLLPAVIWEGVEKLNRDQSVSANDAKAGTAISPKRIKLGCVVKVAKYTSPLDEPAARVPTFCIRKSSSSTLLAVE